MSDEISFEKSEGLSFREIVMTQFKKIVDLSNVEFRGGFYTEEAMSNGTTKEIYVPDTRETFCNAVIGFTTLTMPRFDERMIADYNKYREKMRVIEKNFIDSSEPDEEVILGEKFYQNEKDRIRLETYKNKKLILHQALFCRLSALLGRKNYFTIGGVTV